MYIADTLITSERVVTGCATSSTCKIHKIRSIFCNTHLVFNNIIKWGHSPRDRCNDFKDYSIIATMRCLYGSAACTYQCQGFKNQIFK
jgi:hypothetical protein